MSEENIVTSVNPDQLLGRSKLRRAAEGGNAEAQFQFGMLYGNGDGVAQDFEQAADWIARAAKQGHAEAQVTLGSLYAAGRGVSRDESAARDWFIKAAEQGLAKAQYVVATMYRFGHQGCRKDIAQAVDWYLKAANQGSTPAQLALGRMLMKGRQVEQDDEAALQWLTLAHVNGSKGAEEYIKELLQRIPAERLEILKTKMNAGGGNRPS